MECRNFGELLKKLRLEKGWSQEEACKDICDRKTYIRWENNKFEPSLYYFNLLSNRFNYDLQAYYKLFICDVSQLAWEYKEKAAQYVNNNEWELLWKCIHEIKELPDFSYGENKMTCLYYFALYYSHFLNDYNTSIEYCISGLQEEDINISTEHPTGKIYSNIGFCLLNCLCTNFKKAGETQQATDIYLSIIHNIDKKIIPDISYYQSLDFEKRLYQSVIHNLCLGYKQNGDIVSALKYIEKGVDFSNKHHYLEKLPDLLELKFKLLYQQGNFISAKETYNLCVGLYKFQNRLEEYRYCKELLRTDYSKLLSIKEI